VAGKTTTEAGAHLAALLNKDYLVNPQVTVDVVTYAKQHFVVMGSVQSSGTIAFPDEEEMTLVGAIAAAGGATRLADLSKVIVQRANGEVIKVDLRPSSKAPTTMKVRPNDVITVPERLF
jgi:polysaccharide export outer membrane protein